LNSRLRPSLARDFEQEKEIRPYEFDYQSLHYVVRSVVLVLFEKCSGPIWLGQDAPITPAEIENPRYGLNGIA
jgi:hypothetical protein